MTDIQQDIAKAVPLSELLRMVPQDSRVLVERESWSASHPVGRMCHEAADIIDAQAKRIEAHRDYVRALERDAIVDAERIDKLLDDVNALERQRDELRGTLNRAQANLGNVVKERDELRALLSDYDPRKVHGQK